MRRRCYPYCHGRGGRHRGQGGSPPGLSFSFHETYTCGREGEPRFTVIRFALSRRRLFGVSISEVIVGNGLARARTVPARGLG